MGAPDDAWDPGPGWPRYLEVMAQRPHLFVNGDDARLEIVLDPALVAEAERNEAARIAQFGRDADESRVGVVFEDSYLAVIRDAVRFPDGRLGTYIRLMGAVEWPGVAILPVLGERLVLVRHYRHATRREHLEIPRGFAEPSSSIEDNASRELREEIGAVARDIVPLGTMHTNTGISGEEVALFLAGIDSVGAHETDEGINEVVLLTADELAGAIGSGAISDSFTIVAFARAMVLGLLPDGNTTGGGSR